MSNKKINLRNIIKKSTILTGAMALSFGIIALNYNQEDPYFSKHRSNYNSDLAYIKDATVPANTTYITMNEAKTNAPASGQKISISTFNELIDFSNLLNTEGKEAYLDYDYELIANIECDGSKDFNPVGYKQGKPFTGSFNGNGYEITNLQFSNDSKSMAYYSMFSVNEGEITNVGLTYPTLILSSPNDELKSNGGVSYLVGDNKGTVSNSFVIDEATNSDDSAGITAYECRISTLCVKNEGTLSNNYVAVDRVTDSQSTFAEFAEITIEGTASNCYYYNNSISMVVGNRTVYKPSANLADKPTSTGNYVLSKDELKTTLNSKGWKTSATYGSLSTYIPIPYGVQRGLAYNDETKTFTVNNDKDYAYMYELFNYDDYLASERITYKITADIDLIYQPVESYTYTKGIGASIIGDSISGTTTLITNQKSNYPTIYNAKLMDEKRVAKSVGVDCYGLFNFVTGTIKNLNVYAGEVSLDNISTTSNNVKGIGILAGYIESAHIENVHVYGEITKENNSDIKEYYLGGVTGILGGAGVLTNVTAAGSFNIVAATNTIGTSAYMKGIAIGGIAGYLEDSFGHISDATSAVNIDTKLGSSNVTYAVGGIIGAGYTTNYNYVENELNRTKLTGNLENVGNITVGATSGTSSYSSLYVSGIIGRHMGTTAQVSGFNNIGEIKAYVNANNTYVSGVENVDFNVSKSQFKNNAGKSIFYASSFTNGEEVKVLGNPDLSNDNLKYTNVINIKAGNGLVSQLEGIYNLAYNEKYNNSGSKAKAAITAQAIDMNKVKNFAPVLNVVGGTANYTTTVSKIYNLRDLTFDTSNTASTNFKYAGVALGQYISFEDVRNEGKLTFTLDNAITGNLIVAGLFEEVSSKMKANNIYNAGDIDVNYTANFTGNIYASGICYKNENGFTDTEIAKYNPSSDTYDNTLVGSINNAINKGSVKVSSTSFSGISYSYNWYRNTELTENVSGSVAANIIETSYTGAKLSGNINVAGVVAINKSIITNTFNIAKIKALNYITETDSLKTNQINAGGIVSLNVGKYAYIENSANDGDVTAANLSSYDYGEKEEQEASVTFNDSTKRPGKIVLDNITRIRSDVTVGGIVSRNDKSETGTQYDNTLVSSSQVISFTINYGSVYAYNFVETSDTAKTSTASKAAGIIGSGLCNVINVNNYASVYSGDVAAGIFGLVSLSSFGTEVNSNTIYIANTINYGNIYSLKHAYDQFKLAAPELASTTSLDNDHPKYADFREDKLADFKFISQNSNIRFKYFIGSVIGVIDFANSTSAATHIVVRYLVSFNENISISGAEINVNSSVTATTTTIFSPYLKPDVDGKKDRDDYLATNVQYAPLSSESVTADFLLTNSASGGNKQMTFYGVFNEKFTFREVIEGKITDGDTTGYFNTSTYNTDRFLTDFFQFIPYSFVNESLMEKIEWKTGAYLDAANKFANSLEGTYKLYKSSAGLSANYTEDLTVALKTHTWSQYANPEILVELVKKLIDGNDKTAILAYIEYIFSDSNANSTIFTSELRGTIVDYVYDKYPTLITESELINFADGYSQILTNALCSNTSNLVKDDVLEHINGYITSLKGVIKEELLLAYIDYLKDAGDTFFDTATTSTSKYDLLTNLFSTITDESFYSTLLKLFSTENQGKINTFTDTLSTYGGYQTLTADQKVAFFTNVINNNSYQDISTYLNTFATEIGLFDYLREDGYDEQSFTGIQTNVAYNDTNNTNSDVIDERVKLWNKIKDTTTFQNWFSSVAPTTSYYLATEVNNTYQTDSAPVPYGYSQDAAIQMVNSPNPNVLGSSTDFNFIYTEDVTPNTYFYGPYAAPTENGYTQVNEVYILNVRNYAVNINGSYYYASNPVQVGTDLYIISGGYVGNKTNNAQLDGTYYRLNNGNYVQQTTYNSSYQYYQIIDRNFYIPTSDGTTLSETQQGTVKYNVVLNRTLTNLRDDANGANYTKSWYSVLLTEGTPSLSSVATGATNGVVTSTNPFKVRKRVNIGNYDNSVACGAGVQLIFRTKMTDDYIIFNGVKQSLGNVELKREVSTETNYVLGNLTMNCSTSNTYTVYKSDGTPYEDGQSKSNWDYLLENYVYEATVNTVNTNWHSTGRTGVYVKFYLNGGDEITTQKRIEYYLPYIFTTRYIDYSATQLLKLDGVLTKYDGKTVSNDERNIINDIFNTILCTSANRTAFMQVVAKALFESFNTNTTNHIAFIDNFASNGVTTTTKVGTVAPLEYLKYSSTQTILAYLNSLNTGFGDNKKKILNAASRDKAVFVELMEILFDKSLTVGAETSWTPDGVGYGTSTDLKALYDKLNSSATTISGGTPYVPKSYALPIRNASSNFVTPTTDKTTTLVGNSLNKEVVNATTQSASATNIGYYVGAELKMYKDTSTNYSKYYFPSNSSNSIDLDNQNGTNHASPSTSIREYLNNPITSGSTTYRNGDYLMRIASSQQELNAVTNEGNLVYVQNGRVGSYTGPLLLPIRTVWVAPTEPGTMKFVIVNSESAATSFAIQKLTRSTPKNYSSYFTSSTQAFYYNGTLLAGKAYYFEYTITQADIDAGYEYAISGGDSKKPYVAYIDMGASGEKDLTPEKTYYIQDQVKNLNLNQLITYLTPLNAGSNLISYVPVTGVTAETYSNYYTFSKATTYNESTTYYAKSGNNYIIASNVTAANVTDYYVISVPSSYDSEITYYRKYLVSDYQELVFNTRFMKWLAKSSKEATYALIKSLKGDKSYEEMLYYLLSQDRRVFDSIISYANTNNKLTDDLKHYLTGAWLATDYYRKYKTDLRTTLLNTKLGSSKTYINITGEQSIDIEKFVALCDAIGYDLDMNYGIFALASNKGIKNGVFIPDNLDITKMDDPYSKDTTLNVITLDDNDSNEWRGGETASPGDKTTVNYAFFIDMKQLKQSISTAVFEFDITYGGATLYGDIDNNEKTVTFYVSGDTTGTGTITNAVYADKATSTKKVGGTVSNNSTFVVTAENNDVKATYTVIFKTLDVDFSLKYSDNTETKTVGIADFDPNYTVTLTLTSATGKKLPTGLNLEPYISFVGTNTYKSTDENPLISLSSSSVDHIVDANGNATITIVVSPELPGDTYQIKVAMLTASDSVEFTKNKSTQNAITKIQYQGTDVTFTDNVATTTIPFGRAFDYVELTDPTNENFYLNEFEISYNATAVLTATKSVNEKGLMTYTVTITVRSESGAKATYTHKLVENQYFADDIYAYLYADGEKVGIPANYSALDEDGRIVNLKDGTFTYDKTKDDFTGSANSSLADTMKMLVSFNRGHEPQYRVKYVLTNFYTLGENVVFAPTAATLANGATVNNTYAGLTVTVSNNNDTGVYTFVYTYTNKGTWNDGDYTRYYEFPELIIEKLASTDALLRKITFLEEAVSLGNTATVILPNSVLVPKMDDQSSVGYSNDDVVYNEAFRSNEREINVTHSGIQYSESAKTASDYFVIGTVSNADLSYYCPTFAIEEHAQMYQYTTLEKLIHYGAGRQTAKDKVVLTNHDTMYLYVPFRNATSKEIFLVELNNGKWTNVYSTAFNGTNGDTTLIGTFATDVTTKHHENATVEGYTVSEYAGDATNNDSLFMDYVGTPVDGHFWYVSYVIFSEDYLDGSRLAGNIRYYHISIIDLTNNIQFYVKVYAPSDFTLTDIYLTISENIYKNSESSTRQISAYAQNLNSAIYDGNRIDIKNYKLYTLRYDLQTLPQGYFYFFVDLPEGYIAKSYTSMANELDGDDYETEEAGSFLPHTSIITQKVNLEIIINKGTEIDNSAWAISTSDIYTIQANYEGTILPEPSNN